MLSYALVAILVYVVTCDGLGDFHICDPNQLETIPPCICDPGFFKVYTSDETRVSCAPCANGTYSSEADMNNHCSVCPPGKYSVSPGAVTCTDCEVNSYNPFSGQDHCLPCPEGFVMPVQGASMCEKKEASPESDPDLHEGSFSFPVRPSSSSLSSSSSKQSHKITSTASDVCNGGAETLPPCVCGQGEFKQYADDFTSVWCVPCAAGSYQSFHSTMSNACELCMTGHFSGEGAGNCTACSAGSYADTMGMSICDNCAAGTFIGFQGAAGCEDCATGHSSLEGRGICNPCSAGSYADTMGMSVCDNCNAGTFIGFQGAAGCEDCATGHYSLQGYTSCDQCTPGSYADSQGMSRCEDCHAGRSIDFYGAADCVDCAVGHYAAEGQSDCDQCSQGTYANHTGLSICEDCAPGTFAAIPASLFCDRCELGYYSSKFGEARCDMCPTGTFGDDQGLSSCEDCRPGTFASIQASIECDTCASGYYALDYGQANCEACEPGSWNRGPNNTKCKDCEPGETQPGHHSSGCVVCTAGRATETYGSPYEVCPSCQKGKYNDHDGAYKCDGCGISGYTVGQSPTQCHDCFTWGAGFGLSYMDQCLATWLVCAGILFIIMLPTICSLWCKRICSRGSGHSRGCYQRHGPGVCNGHGHHGHGQRENGHGSSSGRQPGGHYTIVSPEYFSNATTRIPQHGHSINSQATVRLLDA